MPPSDSPPRVTPPYPPTSRYYLIETATLIDREGREIVYLRRRFLPDGRRFAEIRRIVVRDGDRLDTLAANELGDPEQYWRICDAHEAMKPSDLTAIPGTEIRITLPEGIPPAGDE